MIRSVLLLLPCLTLLAVLAPRLEAKRGRGPTIVEKEDGKYLHLTFEDDAKAQAWLYRTMTGDEDEDGNPTEPVDLIVALHGAGGKPKNFVMPLLMQGREAWCLTVAGTQEVQTDRGQGFMWSGGDVKTIVAFVKHVIGKYPIHKDRVVVWGHSAGGTMTLATLGEAPDLFAGGLTTAAPATPDGRHKEKRVCVFLGTEDANWGGAASVRSYVESLAKKRAKGACAFFAVEGLGHDVPYDDYLGLGFDWILHGAARGGEATVPRRSKGEEGAYRHILVRFKGAQGAEGVKRSKSKAKKLLKSVAKELGKNRAYFPFEAACHSEDAETAGCGGGIDEDELKAFLPELPELEPGAVSEILESAQGLHLVYRAVPDPDDE